MIDMNKNNDNGHIECKLPQPFTNPGQPGTGPRKCPAHTRGRSAGWPGGRPASVAEAGASLGWPAVRDAASAEECNAGQRGRGQGPPGPPGRYPTVLTGRL